MLYKNQEFLTLQLETMIDLTTATSVAIIYKKPSGELGEWTSSINGSIIEYNFDGSELDAIGMWQFQAKAVFPTGTALGAITKQRVINPLV